MIKKVMNIFMISCRKATELIEKKLYLGLTPPEKVKLKMHTAMCNACRNYEQQSTAIDTSLHKFIEKIPSENTSKTPSDLKEKIKTNLENL